MGQTPKKSSRAMKTVALIIIITVATVGVYAGLTYPRAIISLPVSFTIVGAQSERKELEVPFLHSQVQVEVSVTSGTALWSARISSDDQTIWSHTAAQSGQTTYKSEWILLSTGHYNFTFATIGVGALNADVSVTSKGGFW